METIPFLSSSSSAAALVPKAYQTASITNSQVKRERERERLPAVNSPLLNFFCWCAHLISLFPSVHRWWHPLSPIYQLPKKCYYKLGNHRLHCSSLISLALIFSPLLTIINPQLRKHKNWTELLCSSSSSPQHSHSIPFRAHWLAPVHWNWQHSTKTATLLLVKLHFKGKNDLIIIHIIIIAASEKVWGSGLGKFVSGGGREAQKLLLLRTSQEHSCVLHKLCVCSTTIDEEWKRQKPKMELKWKWKCDCK